MFEIFKTKVKESIKPVQKKLSVAEINKIIDEIHDTFNTEVDRLLEQANIKVDNSTDKAEILAKAKKLEALGFGNSLTVKEADVENYRLSNINASNKINDELKEAILYFSAKYPYYKFITEDSIGKICEKYNLVFGSVKDFIGDVPDKNLQEIENFKIQDEDKAYCVTSNMRDYSMSGRFERERINMLSKDQYEIDLERYRNRTSYSHHSSYNFIGQAKMSIAAPLKDFNMKDKEVKDNKIVNKAVEIPDPVVCQPVMFKNKCHYLIVTAWGQEASDELVVNEKMN
jgi:hypothetical protein